MTIDTVPETALNPQSYVLSITMCMGPKTL